MNIRADDLDMIRKHYVAMDNAHHIDEADDAELAERISNARQYIRRSCRRGRSNSRRMNAFVGRLFAVSLALFLAVLVVL